MVVVDVSFFGPGADRFWRNVSKAGECWNWQQSTGSHGYGQTWDGNTVLLAHRVAFVLASGNQIPEGLTVDHICRNRRCVNPAHLRLLSNVENARDNGNARKTHCPQGHPYDDANTRFSRVGHRTCRACAAMAARKRAA